MYKIKEYCKNIFKNKLIIFLQIIVSIISISYILINNCRNYELKPGNNYITEESISNWQFMKTTKYNFENLSEISKIKYYNIYSYTYDNNIIFKGNIMLFNKENEHISIFKEFLSHPNYFIFINDFKKEIGINNISYKIEIKEGYLFLYFLGNCKNNPILIEEDNKCFIKDNIYENINIYLNDFFRDKIILPDKCYNNHYYIFLILFFNILLLTFSCIRQYF